MQNPHERYFVYMLRCSDGSYYTGVTNDLEERMKQHGEGIDPSCYTYNRRPLQFVYRVSFREVMDAIAWEKQVKRWSRRKKEALIRGEYERLPLLLRDACGRKIHFMRAMVRRAHHDTIFLCHPELVEGRHKT